MFRDHEFTSDLHSRAVKRIADVRYLRARNCRGRVANSRMLCDEAYQKIDNFYTLTVYEGLELIRMYRSSKDGFEKGWICTFNVTTDRRWRRRISAMSAPTPRTSKSSAMVLAGWHARVERSRCVRRDAKTYALTLTQTLPTTNDVKARRRNTATHPVASGAGADGADMVLGEIACEGDAEATLDSTKTTAVCRLTEFTQTFTFKNVRPSPCRASCELLGPVKLTVERTRHG